MLDGLIELALMLAAEALFNGAGNIGGVTDPQTLAVMVGS